VTLTDAGPLIALLDKGDEHHRASHAAASRTLPHSSMLTTWACFTEAMYVLGEIGGYRYRAALWELRSRGTLRLHDLSQAEVDRAAELMHKYADVPMDLGDATLVAAAEHLRLRQIFTFDHHFRIYRMPDGSVLEMVPG
jgi:predicted nucleic acid-binding protein